MPWGAAAAAAVIGGSIIQGNQASKAANAAAQQQRDAAAQAAEAARFRPYGVTTGVATSTFGDNTATYQLTPDYQAVRDFALSQARAGQTDTETLLGLGRQYISASPEEARQQFIMQQRSLLAPGQEAQYNQIKSDLQRTGRGGFSIGQGGQLAAANPELQAYYNSLALQEARLAAAAEQEGRARTAYGQGLLSSAYSPITSPLGLATSIEEAGQGTITQGAQLGGAQAQAGANVGRYLLEGGLAASRTQQQAASWSPWGTALSGLGQSYMGGAFKGMGGGGGGTPQYTGPSYGTNSSFDNSWFNNNSYD
jgi:hypothetical protein